MTKREKMKLQAVADALQNELVIKNKNLTRRQFYAANDALGVIKDMLNTGKIKRAEYHCNKIGLDVVC